MERAQLSTSTLLDMFHEAGHSQNPLLHLWLRTAYSDGIPPLCLYQPLLNSARIASDHQRHEGPSSVLLGRGVESTPVPPYLFGLCSDFVLDRFADVQRRHFSIAVARLGLTFVVPDLHCHVYPLASSWLPIRSFDGPSDESRRSPFALFGPSPVIGRPRSWAAFIALLLRKLDSTRRPFLIRVT